jgi:cytochrome c peroxidase
MDIGQLILFKKLQKFKAWLWILGLALKAGLSVYPWSFKVRRLIIGVSRCIETVHSSIGSIILNTRHIPLVAILISLCLGLSACGGGASSASGTTTPTGVTNFTTLDFGALANYANPVLPAYYDATVVALDNTPANNATTDKVATLGRVLFYDKRLSINDTISCSSCHQQATGFDDPRRFSVGFSGAAFTTAHAMRLGNIRYYQPGSMFWDKRAASVEAQSSQPIQHPVEMGFTTAAGGIPALIAKMNATTYYPDLFTFAFGDATISEARIQQAFGQFERAMVSYNSKWDTEYAKVFNANANNRGLGTTLAGFTAQEDRGRQLFIAGPNNGGAGCAACHQPPTFALAANSKSNGLDAGETVVFKAPSLKNVALSKAFMHDGRFATLEEVVEHYNSGVKLGPALDTNRLAPNGVPLRLNLSADDKSALVAFMKTLTDNTLTTDVKFSDPFKK